MDYDEYLINYYITQIGPVTSQAWFHSMIAAIGAGTFGASNVQSIISYLGFDVIATNLNQLKLLYFDYLKPPNGQFYQPIKETALALKNSGTSFLGTGLSNGYDYFVMAADYVFIFMDQQLNDIQYEQCKLEEAATRSSKCVDFFKEFPDYVTKYDEYIAQQQADANKGTASTTTTST